MAGFVQKSLVAYLNKQGSTKFLQVVDFIMEDYTLLKSQADQHILGCLN